MFWGDDGEDLFGMNSEFDWMLLEEEMDTYLGDDDNDYSYDHASSIWDDEDDDDDD